MKSVSALPSNSIEAYHETLWHRAPGISLIGGRKVQTAKARRRTGRVRSTLIPDTPRPLISPLVPSPQRAIRGASGFDIDTLTKKLLSEVLFTFIARKAFKVFTRQDLSKLHKMIGGHKFATGRSHFKCTINNLVATGEFFEV